MANYQVGLTLRSFTATGSSAAADHPASHVGLPVDPFLTWRSTGAVVNTDRIVLDFGSVVALDAIFLNNLNFLAAKFEHSADNISYTQIGLSGASQRDHRVKRRKFWASVGNSVLTTPFNNRYLRISPQATATGDPFFEIGVIACLQNVITLADNPAPPKVYDRAQAETRDAFLCGAEDVSEDGDPYVEFSLRSSMFRQSSGIKNQLFDIMDIGLAAPIVIYENQISDGLIRVEHAYLVRRIGDGVTIAEQATYFDTELRFREPV